MTEMNLNLKFYLRAGESPVALELALLAANRLAEMGHQVGLVSSDTRPTDLAPGCSFQQVNSLDDTGLPSGDIHLATSWDTLAAAGADGTPVLHLCGAWESDRLRDRALAAGMVSSVYRTVFSNTWADTLRRFTGNDAQVIPGGYDERLFYPCPPHPPGSPVRLGVAPSLAATAEEIGYVLGAVGQLVSRGLAVSVHVFGSDPLPGTAGPYSFPVEYLGHQTGGGRAKTMQSMDLMVAPVFSPEMGYQPLVLEAMASGLPSVLTAVPCFQEMCSETKPAILVAPGGDETGLAQTINMLLTTDDQRYELRDRAIAYAIKNTVSRMISTLEKACRDILIVEQSKRLYAPALRLATDLKVAEIGPASPWGTTLLASVARQVTVACTTGDDVAATLAQVPRIRIGCAGDGSWGLEARAFDLVLDLAPDPAENTIERIKKDLLLLQPEGTLLFGTQDREIEEITKNLFNQVERLGDEVLAFSRPVPAAEVGDEPVFNQEDKEMSQNPNQFNAPQWSPKKEEDTPVAARGNLPGLAPQASAQQQAPPAFTPPPAPATTLTGWLPPQRDTAPPAAAPAQVAPTQRPTPAPTQAQAGAGMAPSWNSPAPSAPSAQAPPAAAAPRGAQGWAPSWSTPTAPAPAPQSPTTGMAEPLSQVPATPEFSFDNMNGDQELEGLVQSLEETVCSVHQTATQALICGGEYAKALCHSTCLLMFEKKTAENLNVHGWLHYLEGNDQEALAAFSEVLAFDPTNADVLYNQGMVFYSQGRQEEAATAWQGAIQNGYRTAEVFNNLGVIYYTQNRVQEAADCFRHSLEADPDYAEARENLAGCTR